MRSPSNTETTSPAPELARMLRLSDPEWHHLRAQSQLAELAPSQLLRKLVQGVDLTARPHLQVYLLKHQLGRAGNNLAQLERVASAAGQGDIALTLQPVLRAISAWLGSPPEGRISDGSRSRRPQIPTSSEPRQVRSFRVTEIEWAAFQGEATSLEKRPTTYLREQVVALDLAPRSSPVRRSAARSLEALGRRLNRCAKRANEHGIVIDPLDVRAAADEFMEWLEQTRSRAIR